MTQAPRSPCRSGRYWAEALQRMLRGSDSDDEHPDSDVFSMSENCRSGSGVAKGLNELLVWELRTGGKQYKLLKRLISPIGIKPKMLGTGWSSNQSLPYYTRVARVSKWMGDILCKKVPSTRHTNKLRRVLKNLVKVGQGEETAYAIVSILTAGSYPASPVYSEDEQ